MSYIKTITKAAKGTTRCFQCRKLTPSKDGEWRTQGNQQVFLCKACRLKPAQPV